jgi:uncharacterized membrane protein YhhN
MTGAFWLLPASGVLALFYLMDWPPRQPGLNMIRMAVKAGSVLLLAVFATVDEGPGLLTLALVFGAVGDAFLVHDGRGPFVGGLTSFLLAHAAYAVLFFTGYSWNGSVGAWQFGLGCMVTVLAGLMVRMIWEGANGLRGAVVLYAAAIVAMCCTAIATGEPGLILGALLFFSSDACLAIEKFRPLVTDRALRMSRAFVWTSYYLAQIMIMLSWLVSR